MLGAPTALQTPPLDSSRSALEFIHRLLTLPSQEQADLDGLLDALMTAFGATAAGLATFPESTPLCYRTTTSGRTVNEVLPPWREQFDLVERLPQARTALTLPRGSGGSYLLTLVGTPESGSWILWLEDDNRIIWSDSESALLTMAGQALMHRLMADEGRTPWAVQLDRSIRRSRMDAAARIVRRLSHDFGNILTGILGFSELALAHPTASDSPLYDFLNEIHRGAQSGTQYTNQLRLFSRRQAAIHRSCSFADALAEVRREWRATSGENSDSFPVASRNISSATPASFRLQLNASQKLPAVAVDSESLRQVLTIVLENAREAIDSAGVIDISAEKIEIDAREACTLLGDVRPGTHLEIRIADNGSGLTAEAKRQLFAEPFFSTKPRKRGFGLAMAYGILAAHRGAIELLPRPEGGTIARLLLPVAGSAVPSF